MREIETLEMREQEESAIYKGYGQMASLASSPLKEQGKYWLSGVTASLEMPSGWRHRMGVGDRETAAGRACVRQDSIPSGAILPAASFAETSAVTPFVYRPEWAKTRRNGDFGAEN